MYKSTSLISRHVVWLSRTARWSLEASLCAPFSCSENFSGDPPFLSCSPAMTKPPSKRSSLNLIVSCLTPRFLVDTYFQLCLFVYFRLECSAAMRGEGRCRHAAPSPLGKILTSLSPEPPQPQLYSTYLSCKAKRDGVSLN